MTTIRPRRSAALPLSAMFMVMSMLVVVIALMIVPMVVQMVAIHIHAPVEITIRLMQHRA